MKRCGLTGAMIVLAALFSVHCLAEDHSGIQPYSKNPRYWQYENQFTILLGGTDDDNLFQWPNLKEHLDLLASAGGNYIRNTMSDRKDKGFELYPFKELENGKYDLNQWNPEYWTRFENMLKWTSERKIIVQIEIWDRFDYSDQNGANRWQIHPYNPKNNINYTYEESGFDKEYPDHPGRDKQHFFYSVPGMERYKAQYDVFRRYQEAFVEKLLSYSLQYNNVLYCMNNETDSPPIWGQYWIDFIKKKAEAANVKVMVSDMFDNWDIKHRQHHVLYDHPEIYSFIDVSQNNHNKGQTHWDNIQWARDYISQSIRPLNTVKIYGADAGRFGNDRDGQERFWRNIFGGIAATRFHRPDSGLGCSPKAQAHVKSMRMLLSRIDLSTCAPDAQSRLLQDRSDNEAYLTFDPGKQYALFFPDGGEVGLDLTQTPGKFTCKWLDIMKSEWRPGEDLTGGRIAPIRTPEEKGYWAAAIVRSEN
ncbi:MAG: hypothetical protein JXR73_02090 [Candidatus Omnitrophica bacterium]|nr:hypothetical protein [Candidatus Omnitrophota bacterium]